MDQTSSARDRLGFAPIRRQRCYEQIYDRIIEAVTCGTIGPGDRLPAERELAKAFEVSRQGVREAIRALESSGIVEIRLGTRGGAFIRNADLRLVTQAMTTLASLGAFSPDSLQEARTHLTGTILRLACERRTAEDLRAIEADIAITEERGSTSSTAEPTQLVAFDRLLAEATHNEVLVMLYDALAQAVSVPLMRVAVAVDPCIGQVRRRLLQHIRERNPDAAIAELHAHLNAVER